MPTTASCDAGGTDVCTQAWTSSTEFVWICDLANNGDTDAASATAIMDHSSTTECSGTVIVSSVPHNANYCAYGTDAGGNQFCCETVSTTGHVVTSVELKGGPLDDTLSFQNSSYTMDGNGLYSSMFVGKVFGRAGDDTITGSWEKEDNAVPYHDELHGDDGRDLIYGDDGDDFITGDNHEDEIHGEAGDDTIYGNSGADTITGGTGNDKIYGGDESDNISGNDGDDLIQGGGHDDVICGDLGPDTIYGNTGDDQIWGAEASDTIDGGPEVSGDSCDGLSTQYSCEGPLAGRPATCP